MQRLLASATQRCLANGQWPAERGCQLYLRLWRKTGSSISDRRSVHISCRGLPISDQELFRYTNGRFLANEDQQLSKRYVTFDVQKLCQVVASSTEHGSPVCKIDKMEGGFSKALLMTTEDGVEVVAKIPCPNAGRAMYSTASEAATLQFVRSRTTIPVPKVLAWSADSANPVGAEYIIMEKAPGIQLFKVWDDITEFDRLQLIQSLTQLESQLAAISFPAYGNVYFRHSISKPSERILLDQSVDPDGLFCVGPACGPAWTDGTSPADLQPDLDAGPWPDLTRFGDALALRSAARTRLPVPSTTPPSLHGTVDEHISTQHTTSTLLPRLTTHPAYLPSSTPTLWHTDLHMGNIFVSPRDPTQILSVIDWQSIGIAPLFLQVRWPIFLSPPEGYTDGAVLPKLPDDYDTLDADEKEIARHHKLQTTCAKAYEVATFRHNRPAYRAKWEFPDALRELFVRCGDTWDDGIAPLRACLMRLCESWEELGFAEPCPISFSPAEIEDGKTRFEAYGEWYEIQEVARKYLDTDAEGWIAPELDFAGKRADNEALLGLMIERLAPEKEEEEVRRVWPFPPH